MFLHVGMCMCVQVAMEVKRDPDGSGVKRWLEANWHRSWELNSGPPQEQPVLLTMGPSLQPLKLFSILEIQYFT